MMAKTFKTIRPYTPPPPEPYRRPNDDGSVFVPAMNYKRVPASAAVIQDALKWWKASVAVNGMGANPNDPNCVVEETPNWLLFKLDGKKEFAVDRNSNNLLIQGTDRTLLDRIARWKQEAKGLPPVGSDLRK